MDFKKAQESFEKYIKQFDLSKEQIKIKIFHTYTVVRLMEKLAKRIGLNEDEIELAKIIGLLHDIGRFQQFQESGEMDDLKSKINHAQLGCDYLFKENHICDYMEDRQYDGIIQKAILNHNKLEIEEQLEAKELLFSRMIRDTDKIDIFRVLAIYFENELMEEEITDSVLKAFKQKKLVVQKNSKTNSDNTLNTLSYIYDINFKESYELLEETDNLGLYISSLNIPKRSEEFAEKIIKEIYNKIADGQKEKK